METFQTKNAYLCKRLPLMMAFVPRPFTLMALRWTSEAVLATGTRDVTKRDGEQLIRGEFAAMQCYGESMINVELDALHPPSWHAVPLIAE